MQSPAERKQQIRLAEYAFHAVFSMTRFPTPILLADAILRLLIDVAQRPLGFPASAVVLPGSGGGAAVR